MDSARLSNKGRVIIPKRVREAHGWKSGLVFDVIETPDGLLLRPHAALPSTKLEDVAGCLRDQVSRRTDAQIADALHLALSQGQGSLRTFDRDFARKARGKGDCVVESP